MKKYMTQMLSFTVDLNYNGKLFKLALVFFNHTQNDCRKSCTISLPLKAYESIAIIRLWTEVISKVTNFGLE